MRRIKLMAWIAVHLAAALVPLASMTASTVTIADTFPGWPLEFQGQPLYQLPLTEREEFFARDFPGRIGRFHDGTRELIIRWVKHPSRKLHPAADCLKGAGYATKSLPLQLDHDSHRWGCTRATRSGETLRVCEAIFDDNGQSWSDVSAWFWAAVLDQTDGPWWAVTVAS